ncbi:hypothetical protein K432DRAFT_408124 [Lepidopterella palustris CBS 459.81]|uniref:Fungal calcium binding protein domain-containing protein n=1 Tax=Lepidopterella palustris CBS 459.81 TaxID=1314670 RepID=A0A8E2E3F4_9PEZI|nr:hypothetical protein K432DRAFT_408124 [Lepidopterella palustris CBS 459.81]
MRFITILQIAFAAIVAAAPAPAPAPAPVPVAGFEDLIASAQSALDLKTADGCEIAKCVAALAPLAVSCAAAAAEEGLNPLADAACLASAANNVANTPAACTSCL